MVQVVAHSDGGEREPDVVTEEMKAVAPPGVPPHADVVQDLLEVQTHLEANQALVLDRRFDSITLGAVGDREEQPAQRPEVESQTPAEPGDLEIGRVGVMGIGGARQVGGSHSKKVS